MWVGVQDGHGIRQQFLVWVIWLHHIKISSLLNVREVQCSEVVTNYLYMGAKILWSAQLNLALNGRYSCH